MQRLEKVGDLREGVSVKCVMIDRVYFNIDAVYTWLHGVVNGRYVHDR